MKIKKRLVGLMLAAALATLPVAFTSCEGLFGPTSENSSVTSTPPGDQNVTVPFEGTGEYYCSASAGEYTLTIGETDGQLVMGSETLTYTYTYDGKVLKFELSDSSSATATVDGTVLSFRRGNNTYKFYKNVQYTVTYESNGGSAVESEPVTNGKTATGQSAPTKEGYWFVGWYTDSACKNLYDFDTPVMSDVTLYARFVEKADQQEFKVSFVVDGAEAFNMETRGGVIYNSELPTPEVEGKTFMGWWVSTYDDAEKLSYKYDEQVLGEDTTLYAVWETDAPSVSVTAEGVSWNAVGGSTYKVVIKNAAGNQVGGTMTPDTSYAFDFSAWAEGDYTVEVSVSGNANVGTAHYQNKALDTVNYFKVSEDRVLTFNEVRNATKYLITVSCGDAAHEHNNETTTVEVTSPVFDFSGCQMQKGGITFQVQAVANGYVSSTSETYNFEANLEEVTGLEVNEATEIATWNAVENATSYMVEIVDDGVSLGVNEQAGTTVDLRGLTGVLEVKVYPVARGYNSSVTKSATFDNKRLAMPLNVRLDVAKQALVWDAVDGATGGYKVKIGDVEYTVSGNEFVLTDEHFTNNVSVLSVQAICDDEAKASIYSDAVTVRSDNTMNAESLVYNNGVISWDGVLGAAKYGVRVNEGEEFFVEDATKAQIAFTQAGDAKIEVRSYNAEGATSDWVSKTVAVYTIAFEAEGGVSVDPMYKAAGDNVTLPETEYQGYTFAGWYNIPNALENNGQKYEASFLQGAADLTLYAGYTANKYIVSLELGTLGVSDKTSEEVWYHQAYELPVPECTDVTKVFAGWWTEPNGQGIQYANLNGVPANVWNDARNVTLYASWYDVLSFVEVGTGATQGYAVSKNDEGIRYVEEITIPAEYNGLPVTMIDGGAFADCTNLKTINIPDTIRSIFISSDNVVDTGSAFEGCTRLEKIKVYCVDNAAHTSHEVFYESDSVGALLHNNSITGKKEFKYLPESYTGTYQIPDGVEVIPTSAFADARITKLIIPASVTQIDSSAFAGCSSLTELEFLPAAEGVAEQGLMLANGVFEDCTSLTTLNLPARVANLNLDIFQKTLQRINITGNGVAGAAETYHSIDGVLCKGTTLVYVPRGMRGDYRIPGGIFAVGEEAFANCTAITSVSIPAWVTSIEKYAFLNCTSMRTLTFEEGDATQNQLDIAESAFYSCRLLTEVTLPVHLNVLGKSAFGGTSQLKKVTVNGDGANFATGVFADNSGKEFYVTEVYLGKNVQTVEIAAVFGTTKLATVVVDENNPYIASQDSVLYDAAMETILYYPKTRMGAFVIPDTVKTISAGVFTEAKFTAITIPGSVTLIEENAFKKCLHLREIIWLEGTEGLRIESGAFWNVTGVENMTIPARVTYIGEGAFANTSFKTVTFEEGELDLVIDAYAFKKVTSTATNFTGTSVAAGTIQSITFPKRLVSIGQEAFYSSFKKTATTAENFPGIDLVIPEGVESIGNNAFKGNDLIKSVSFPSTLTKLGAYNDKGELTSMLVFDGCYDLETLTVADGNTAFKVIDGVLYGLKDGTVTDLYMSPMSNKGNNGVVDIPETVTKIWDKAFYSNSKITKVTFSKGVTGAISFGTNVFGQTTALTSVELPEGMTEVSKQMFNGCNGLVSVTIPSTVTTIAVQAFYNCTKLETIVFAPTPEGKEAVPLTFADGTSSASCFYSCSKLTTMVLPERTEKIGKYAFSKLNITEINIPASVKTIGENAFYQCQKLTTVEFAEDTLVSTIAKNTFNGCLVLNNVTIPASMKTIEANAFELCKALTNLTLSEGLETIKSKAFTGVPLTSLTIPASVKTIEANAFENCAKVQTLTFAEGSVLETIGASAFKGCLVLAAVEIPASVKTIGASAFASCPYLASITFVEENNVLEEIGNLAFSATAVKNFAFPESASQIDLGSGIFTENELDTLHISSTISEITDALSDCEIGLITVSDNNQNFSVMEGQKVLLNKNGDTIRYVYSQLEGEFIVPDNFISVEANVFEGQTKLTKVVLPVTLKQIGEAAFKGCTSLATVEFKTQEGVDHALESIGKQAFMGCTALTSVALPENVKTLGESAFSGCTSLTSVKVNANLSTIETKAFQGATKLTSVELPEGLTKIGQYMFQGASALTSVTIPSTVTEIGQYAFAAASKLASVTITLVNEAEGTSNLKTIGNYAFSTCTSLTSFSIPNSVTSIGTYLFNGCTKLTQVGLPEGIKTIPSYIFQNCGFTQFTIPATVTKIDTYAFKGTKLTSLTIPATVTSIGNYAFQNITTLKSITFEEGTTTTANVAIGNYAFAGCTAVTELNLSSQIKSIGNYAFQKLKITEAVVPEGVTTLGTNVFDSCESLKTATLGSAKLTSIGTKLFNACESLQTVTLREGLTKLSSNMFYGCDNANFTTLVLPSTIKELPDNLFTVKSGVGVSLTSIDLTNVTKVGKQAFKGCKSLKDVTWGTNLTTIDMEAFSGCTALTEANIPTVKSIGFQAFYQCTGLKKVVMEDVNTFISKNSYSTGRGQEFSGCTSLVEVTLPESWTYINDTMFNGCTSLVSIDLPESVNEIRGSAFKGCTKLANISLKNITKLGANAFENCKSLVEVDLSALNTSVGNLAFKGCTALAKVTFNKAMTGIGSSAFSGCTALKTIDLPDGLLTIDASAFNGSGLTSIVIPELVTQFTNGSSIDPTSTAYTFAECKDLTSVVLPEGFQFIGGYVFKNCEKLTSINLPDSMTIIGKEAFMNTGLTEVTLPAGLEKLGDNAFSGCNNITGFSIASSNSNFKTMEKALYTEDGVLQLYPFANIPESGVLTLPEGCTGIRVGTSSASLFTGCETLKEIVFPSTMTSISNYAFLGCTGLETVTIPQTVMEIGAMAFYKCTNLKNLTFEDDGTAEELTFVENVGSYPFFHSEALTDVVIPARIKNIPDRMFSCAYANDVSKNLANVTLSEGIESIGQNAFRNTAISSIEFPSTLTSIGNYAFANTKFTSFTDYGNVTTLGNYVFMGCTLLESVKVSKDVTYGTYTFQNCTALTTVEVEDGVTAIPQYIFQGCTAFTGINLPESVTAIGNYAFSNSGLTSIDLPENLEIIGGYAFQNTKITSIVIPDSLTCLTGTVLFDGSDGQTIPSAAVGIFDGCKSLSSVTLPEGLLSIGGGAFSNCTSLTEIDIPASVRFIGIQAFKGTGITSVEIKNPEIKLYRSFEDAAKLESVTLPEGLKNLGYQTFKNCTALKTIDIPDSVEYFGIMHTNGSSVTNSQGSNFEGSGLESIVLPANLKVLPDKTFYNCKSLKSVTFNEGLETICHGTSMSYVFSGCTALTSLVIPENVIIQGTYNFGSWTKNQTIYVCASEAFVKANWHSSWQTGSAVVVYDYVAPEAEAPEAGAEA